MEGLFQGKSHENGGDPHGKHTKSYGSWPLIVDIPIKSGYFSIVILVHQRVPVRNFMVVTIHIDPCWYHVSEEMDGVLHEISKLRNSAG